MDHEGDYFFLNYSLENLLLVNEINVSDTWPDHMPVWVIAGSLWNHPAWAKEVRRVKTWQDALPCQLKCKRKAVQAQKCSSWRLTRGLTSCEVSQESWRHTCTLHCAIQACSLLNRGMERGRWNWGLNKQVLLQKFWLTQNPSFMCKDAFVHKVGLVLVFWGLFFVGFWLVSWFIYFFSQARDLALCKSGNCNSSHLWYVPTQLILVPSL